MLVLFITHSGSDSYKADSLSITLRSSIFSASLHVSADWFYHLFNNIVATMNYQKEVLSS